MIFLLGGGGGAGFTRHLLAYAQVETTRVLDPVSYSTVSSPVDVCCCTLATGKIHWSRSGQPGPGRDMYASTQYGRTN
jgi:hypothetical protein